MTSNVIYAQGRAEVTIPANESIAVATIGVATVSRELGYPNFPNTLAVLGIVNNSQTVFGPYSSGATVVIEGGAADTFYEVGSAPQVMARLNAQVQVAPIAATVSATLTVTELLNGIIVGTHAAGATQTYTLPTGTLLDAASEFAVNDSFDWTLINQSAAAADTITIAPGADHTIIGGQIIQSSNATTGQLYGHSGRFRTRKTATNTFVTYRIA